MAELTVKLPDAQTPGYLRRLVQAEGYRKQLDTGSVDFDGLVNYLLVFVIEPEDRSAARETLLDLTFEQYQDLLAAIGAPPNPTSPSPTGTS
jgi:hypothetical protein